MDLLRMVATVLASGAPAAPTTLNITSPNYRIAPDPSAVTLAAWSDTLGANETITCEYDNDGTFSSPTAVTGITGSSYAPAKTDLTRYYARFKKVNSVTELESDWSATQHVFVADACHVYLPYGRGWWQDLSKTIPATEAFDPVLKWANEGDLGSSGDFFQDSGVTADAPILEPDIESGRVAPSFDHLQKFLETANWTAVNENVHWMIYAFADLNILGTNNTRLFVMRNSSTTQIGVHTATVTSATTHGMRNTWENLVNGAKTSQNANVFSEAHAHLIAHLGAVDNWKAYIDNFAQYDTGAYTPPMQIDNGLISKNGAADSNNTPQKVFALAWGTDAAMDATKLKALYNFIADSFGATGLKGA